MLWLSRFTGNTLTSDKAQKFKTLVSKYLLGYIPTKLYKLATKVFSTTIAVS